MNSLQNFAPISDIDWRRVALTDQLTDVPNRRALDHHLATIAQTKTLVSIAVIDFDHFKQINDTQGHAAGDRAIRNVAQSLQSAAIWLGDELAIAARFGGDEFVFVANLPPWQLGALALDAVHAAGFKASIGVAFGSAGQSLFDSADKAVFKAKEQGRDRFIVA
jgi:PleD family two-component response regulator